MNQNEVRRGVAQAKRNDDLASWFFIEVGIVSIALGLLSSSWIVFGLTAIVLIVGMNFKQTAMIIGILLTIMWIFIGWKIGAAFGSASASVVISVIFALISIGVHASTFDWNIDINER